MTSMSFEGQYSLSIISSLLETVCFIFMNEYQQVDEDGEHTLHPPHSTTLTPLKHFTI